MKKKINIELVIEYYDIKNEKQAELTASLLEWYFNSKVGREAMSDFMGNKVKELIKSGVVISEGTV